MEMTQENFDKLFGENENYKKALIEERSKRKQEAEEKAQIKAELDWLQTFKKDLEEKEAKKKGKYEDIIVERDAEIAKIKADHEAEIKSLTDELTPTKEKAWKYDEFLTKNLDDKMSKIPEERQEFVKKVLDWKSNDEQLSLLDGFIENYSKGDFKAKPKDEWEDPKNTTEFDKAKKDWDTRWLIANAPVMQ